MAQIRLERLGWIDRGRLAEAAFAQQVAQY